MIDKIVHSSNYLIIHLLFNYYIFSLKISLNVRKYLDSISFLSVADANRPTTIICCTSQNARPTYDVLNEIASNLGANGIQELIYQQTWQPRPPSFLPVDQGGPWSHQRPTNFMPPPQRWPPPTTTPCPPKSPWDGNGNNGALVKKVKAKSDVAQILKDAEEIKIETPQVNARGRFSITFG